MNGSQALAVREHGVPVPMPLQLASSVPFHRLVGYTRSEYALLLNGKYKAKPLADKRLPQTTAYYKAFPEYMDTDLVPTDMTPSEVQKRLMFWPDIPNSVTCVRHCSPFSPFMVRMLIVQAPFLINPSERMPVGPLDQSDNSLLRVLGIPDFLQEILEYFTHEDMKNFALSSWHCYAIVANNIVSQVCTACRHDIIHPC